MNVKLLDEHVYGPEIGMRERTPLRRWVINFIYNEGGMGDFINYSGATVWLEKNAPWVEGKVFVPRYLVALLSDCHQRFEVLPSEEFEKLVENGTTMIGPSIHTFGQNRTPQLFTCLGAHPFDVGFAYYTSTCPPPPDAYLPVLDYPESRLLPKLKQLRGNYVVIPTGNTTRARAVYGRHINPIIRHVKRLGLTPVFLGKKDLLMNGVATTNFPDDIAYAEGLDLRDQTSVKDAATAMQHAKVTVGLDCGLLHLAALMRDSKIVFGHNIASVEHRAPRRNHGKTINLAPREEELKCVGCQSKLKNIAAHKFSECLYGDTLCVDLLFKDDAARWTAAIDELLA